MCLIYLNLKLAISLFISFRRSIFAAAVNDKKLPVIVFLHGESFEWNSGNPYDGTVLASYSEVVVVTLNYRIGLLGEFRFSFFPHFFFLKIIDYRNIIR